VGVCLHVTSLSVEGTETSRHVCLHDLPCGQRFHKQPSPRHTLSYNINTHLLCTDYEAPTEMALNCQFFRLNERKEREIHCRHFHARIVVLCAANGGRI